MLLLFNRNIETSDKGIFLACDSDSKGGEREISLLHYVLIAFFFGSFSN
jgi:hypothetical protein